MTSKETPSMIMMAQFTQHQVFVVLLHYIKLSESTAHSVCVRTLSLLLIKLDLCCREDAKQKLRGAEGTDNGNPSLSVSVVERCLFLFLFLR